MEFANAFRVAADGLPLLLVVISAGITFAHTIQEITGEGGPIWEYLHLTTSYTRGWDLLWAFAVAQILLATFGYGGGYHGCLKALFVIRLADCVASHWMPAIIGRNPNPGLTTSPFYFADAVFCYLVFNDLLIL